MLHIKCGVIFFVKFIQKTLTYYQIFYIIIVLGKILKKDIRKKGNVENGKGLRGAVQAACQGSREQP